MTKYIKKYSEEERYVCPIYRMHCAYVGSIGTSVLYIGCMVPMCGEGTSVLYIGCIVPMCGVAVRLSYI
jgi:hypothetical protein